MTGEVGVHRGRRGHPAPIVTYEVHLVQGQDVRILGVLLKTQPSPLFLLVVPSGKNMKPFYHL